jgi:hypothetical protein
MTVYLPLHSDRVVEISDDDADLANPKQYHWYLHGGGFVCCTVGLVPNKRMLILHRIIYERIPGNDPLRPLCWLLGTSVHKNRRPAPYYRSPLLHCLHKEMLVPKNRQRASLCSMHTQVAIWAKRQKDGVFSLSVEGKQGSEYHNVQ